VEVTVKYSHTIKSYSTMVQLTTRNYSETCQRDCQNVFVLHTVVVVSNSRLHGVTHRIIKLSLDVFSVQLWRDNDSPSHPHH